jgi:hypothetical protein
VGDRTAARSVPVPAAARTTSRQLAPGDPARSEDQGRRHGELIIAGVHQVIVYAPGTRPEDVNTALTRPAQGGGPPLINDPVNRVYAGLDPTTIHGGPPQPRNPLQDRVEVVRFTRKGRHLVICGLFPHFVNDKMYGWVEVVGDAG